MPQISVIVPVYKVEAYLRRCVDSILAQTFTDFELILVDDGSPDNCPVICDEYAKKDGRVRVIHKENGGLSSARNAGMAVAIGRYIMFCDSDDTVEPFWCETLFNIAEENHFSWIMCNLTKITENGESLLIDSRTNQDGQVQKISYYQSYNFGLSGFSVNKIYNKEILDGGDIRFDESCRYAEDVEFNTKYCAFCNQFLYAHTSLYNYYSNSLGITGTYYSHLFEMRLPQFSIRIPLISHEELGEYCDNWLFVFLELFNNVFDDRNTMTFCQKIRYNQRMIKTKEFQYCLHHASGQKESPLVIRILKLKNYYIYWLLEKAARLKQMLKVGGKNK